MTDDRMALLEQIQKSTDGDFLRAIAEYTLHRLTALKVDGLIGPSLAASVHQRHQHLADMFFNPDHSWSGFQAMRRSNFFALKAWVWVAPERR